ncbi:tyrosine-type recombinase/integrase [Neisseria dentiae]|uniref:tyrosine-type recombinase/integrase n=1 Tax=Neisseria dentiae TaxID=194197 RepID=UPI0035A0AF88
MRTPSGERIRRAAGTKDIKKAQELRAKLVHELWQQQYMAEKPKRLWDEAAVQWINERQDKKSIQTDIARLRQLGRLRGMYLHEMSRDVIMSVINDMTCSPSTKNRYIALIRSILYKARDEWEWIDKAPKLKQLKEPTKRVRWLKPEEAHRLVMALPDNYWRHMAVFSLATGLRQSNVFSLKWEQVDLKRKLAWIFPDEAKSGKAIVVPLNDLAIKILAIRQGMHHTYVFTTTQKQVVKSLNRKVWQKALKDAGIRDFRWHDLRHTWASWLIQQGVPLLALKEMGGWEKLDMVMRYAHLAAEHLAPHAGVLDGLEWFRHKMDTSSNEASKGKSLNDCLGF